MAEKETKNKKTKKSTVSILVIIAIILAVVVFAVLPLLNQQMTQIDENIGYSSARAVYAAAETALELCKRDGSPEALGSIKDISGETAAAMLAEYKDNPSEMFRYEIAKILNDSFFGNIYVDVNETEKMLVYTGWDNGTGGMQYGYGGK